MGQTLQEGMTFEFVYIRSAGEEPVCLSARLK